MTAAKKTTAKKAAPAEEQEWSWRDERKPRGRKCSTCEHTEGEHRAYGSGRCTACNCQALTP